MSSKCWRETLTALLTQTNKRLAIVGIGHELRGDDAVGVAIIRRLQEECPNSTAILLLDAGSAPENCTGILRRFAPDNVLLLDAVDMRQSAGSLQWIDLQNIRAVAASTHTLSLCLIENFLQQEIGCNVLLLGIQPLQTELDAPLSYPVEASANEIVDLFVKFVTSMTSTSSGNYIRH